MWVRGTLWLLNGITHARLLANCVCVELGLGKLQEEESVGKGAVRYLSARCWALYLGVALNVAHRAVCRPHHLTHQIRGAGHLEGLR